MEFLGHIIAILNDDLLLFETQDKGEDIVDGEEITVFANIETTKMDTLSNKLEVVCIPKGKIAVLSHQKDSIYLASLVKTETRRRSVYDPSIALGLSRMLFPKSEEVIEEVPIRMAGHLDEKLSLQVTYEKLITVGDMVGRG